MYESPVKLRITFQIFPYNLCRHNHHIGIFQCYDSCRHRVSRHYNGVVGQNSISEHESYGFQITLAVGERMFESTAMYPSAMFQALAGMHKIFTTAVMPQFALTLADLFLESEINVPFKGVELLHNAKLPLFYEVSALPCL